MDQLATVTKGGMDKGERILRKQGLAKSCQAASAFEDHSGTNMVCMGS